MSVTGPNDLAFFQRLAASAKEVRAGQLALLEAIVNIDSGTGQPGTQLVLDAIGREWSALGFDVENPTATAGGGLLLARHRPETSPSLRVLLLGHADTVFEAGTVSRRPFNRLDDGRITGPGVADMKGGLVVMVGVVTLLRQLGVLDRVEVTVLINSDEETGSQDSRAEIERVATGMDLALVFEPGRPGGPLVKSRRGTLRYRLTVSGLAAHSGVNPEDGASAVTSIAHKVIAMQALNRCRPDVSVNVGVLRGGTAVNMVPDSASALIDVRMTEEESSRYVTGKLQSIADHEDVPNTTGHLELLTGRPPLPASSGQEPFVDVYVRAGRTLGQDVEFVATGGGSDGNFTGSVGIPTLDGLGPVGGGYHSDREFIDESTVTSRTLLTAGALAMLAWQEYDERVP